MARSGAPDAEFWLGRDQFGRDTLRLILSAARATVVTAVMAMRF